MENSEHPNKRAKKDATDVADKVGVILSYYSKLTSIH